MNLRVKVRRGGSFDGLCSTTMPTMGRPMTSARTIPSQQAVASAPPQANGQRKLPVRRDRGRLRRRGDCVRDRSVRGSRLAQPCAGSGEQVAPPGLGRARRTRGREIGGAFRTPSAAVVPGPSQANHVTATLLPYGERHDSGDARGHQGSGAKRSHATTEASRVGVSMGPSPKAIRGRKMARSRTRTIRSPRPGRPSPPPVQQPRRLAKTSVMRSTLGRQGQVSVSV